MIELIQSLYGIKQEDLFGRSRKQSVVEPRQLHWLVLRRSGLKYQTIADMYGRTHATIYSGIRHIQGIIESDRRTREFYQKVTNELKRESILAE